MDEGKNGVWAFLIRVGIVGPDSQQRTDVRVGYYVGLSRCERSPLPLLLFLPTLPILFFQRSHTARTPQTQSSSGTSYCAFNASSVAFNSSWMSACGASLCLPSPSSRHSTLFKYACTVCAGRPVSRSTSPVTRSNSPLSTARYIDTSTSTNGSGTPSARQDSAYASSVT